MRLRSVSIVFLVGIAVTALEIASARLVGPYFGTTIYVWAGAIGTVLLALAIGYYLGGIVADKYIGKRILAVVLLIAGGSAIAIPWLSTTINLFFVHANTFWQLPLAVCVIGVMLVLFTLPLVALGMISPIILRTTVTDLSETGKWSGVLSASSTVGSIVGTFVSALYTIPNFGTRQTILGAGVLMVVVAFWLWRLPVKMTILVVVSILLTTYNIQVTPVIARPNVLWDKETAYQYVQVFEREHIRYMVIDAARATQSIYDPRALYTNSAYDVFGILPSLTSQPASPLNILIIGLGGGNDLHMFHDLLGQRFPSRLTVVEIDADVARVARSMFGLSRIPYTLVVDDARHYLQTTNQHFDIMVIDAYTNELQIPPMLATEEFFQLTRQRLAPGGVVGINALALAESRYFPKFLNTVAASFPQVVEAPFQPNSANHIIIAGERVDLTRVPSSIHPVIDEDIRQLVPRFQRVPVGGDTYTDNRTDLDLRVQPVSQ